MLLHDRFDYYARSRGDSCFARCGGQALSYAEAGRRANRMAHAMIRSGLVAGDRLAYVGSNSIDHALVYFATSRIGVVAVPLNPRLTVEELGFIVGDARARLVVADAEHCERLGPLRTSLPTVETWVALDNNGVPDGWCGVDAWLEGGSTGELEHRGQPDDVLYQMYTSGTTGRPKGVLLTHRSVLANCAQVSAGLSYAVEPGHRWLIVAPLFHAAAVITAFSCVAGAGCLVIQKGFDPRAVVDALADEDIALTTLVPSMIQACLATVDDVAARSYPALRAMAYGGSSIAEHTLVRAMEVFGCDFYQGFGQTESSAGLTYLTELDHRAAVSGRPELLASCGQALPGTELRIVDPTGADLPPGEVGEVIARGPQLMSGYWNRPEETAAALRDGWLWTGDAGSLDERGYLTIHDRLRDMVVTGGENVYPREVETVLLGHPSVLDVAVIGVPDVTWGQAVHAVVVVEPAATVDLDSVREHCRDRLAGFKLPRGLTVVDELPRNASGKVLKAELRAPHWADRDGEVS
jgi:acyl-CoA synthetase (AMP-forming)/AMP-acid ligase II